MFVQKQFQVGIESTKQYFKYEILKITNMKFQELQIRNSKNYKYEILRITIL